MTELTMLYDELRCPVLKILEEKEALSKLEIIGKLIADDTFMGRIYNEFMRIEQFEIKTAREILTALHGENCGLYGPDITDRKLAEIKLTQYHRNLTRELQSTLSQMVESGEIIQHKNKRQSIYSLPNVT